MTSPFSIYISIAMLYEKYKVEYFVAYIDSNAGIYTTNERIFPINMKENLSQTAGRDFFKNILLFSKRVKAIRDLNRRRRTNTLV